MTRISRYASMRGVSRSEVACYLVGLGYATFFVLRYGGLWTENDTAQFSDTTMHMLAAGSIVFPGTYVHGFGYPAWLGMVSLISGIPVPVLNTLVFPFIGMALMITAVLATYPLFLPKGNGVIVSALTLFAVADVLFTVLRGNHEKLNIPCILLAFVAFVNVGTVGEKRARVRWYIVLALTGLINVWANDYFGVYMTAAMTIVWLLTWSAGKHLRQGSGLRINHAALLSSVAVVAGTTLLGLMMFSPTSVDETIAVQVVKHLANLFTAGHPISNPLKTANAQWVSPSVALVLGGGRWTIFLVSFVWWASRVWRFVQGRIQLTWAQWVLISLYGTLGLLVAVAIPIDLSGLALGNNLEVRNFTYFALVAAPLTVWGLLQTRIQQRPLMVVLGVLFSIFVFLGQLKITQDPSISNQWMGYTPAEKQATLYFLQHRGVDLAWGGPDGRLLDVAVNDYPGVPWSIVPASQGARPFEFDYLNSPIVREATVLEGVKMPNFGAMDRIFDDGGAQIYRKVPVTPYQR